ncbi:hypothetical protein J0S82_018571, partial [Galemys pyrenaicus]
EPANCSGQDTAALEERGIPFKESNDVLSLEAVKTCVNAMLCWGYKRLLANKLKRGWQMTRTFWMALCFCSQSSSSWGTSLMKRSGAPPALLDDVERLQILFRHPQPYCFMLAENHDMAFTINCMHTKKKKKKRNYLRKFQRRKAVILERNSF